MGWPAEPLSVSRFPIVAAVAGVKSCCGLAFQDCRGNSMDLADGVDKVDGVDGWWGGCGFAL